jgi:hypothetical protein
MTLDDRTQAVAVSSRAQFEDPTRQACLFASVVDDDDDFASFCFS